MRTSTSYNNMQTAENVYIYIYVCSDEVPFSFYISYSTINIFLLFPILSEALAQKAISIQFNS